MNANDVYEAKKKITKMNTDRVRPMPPIPSAQVKKRPRFDERYRRITTYLEDSVHKHLEKLYIEGKVQKKTDFINAAVKEYITNHY
jgi:hypothetical protein